MPDTMPVPTMPAPTLSQWLANPEAIVDAFLAPGGPINKAIGSHYAPSDVQRSYARSVARHAVKGVVSPGTVICLEGETGIGKTIAYLLVGLIHAKLTGTRMLVCTYTNQLKEQVALLDGPDVCLAIEQVFGVYPTIAMRFAYHEFCSPKRAKVLADRIERQGDNNGAVIALRALAAWTEREIENASRKDAPVFDSVKTGLVSTWIAAHSDLAKNLPLEAREMWELDPSCDDDEKVIYKKYADHVKAATCVVTSHASMIIDVKFRGRLLGADKTPFGLAILDEGHRVADAARDILATRTTFLGLERTVRVALEAVNAAQEIAKDHRLRVVDYIMQRYHLFDILIEVSRNLSENHRAKRPTYSRQPVIGDLNLEPWLETCRLAALAAEEIGDALCNLAKSEACDEVGKTLQERGEQMLAFVQAAMDPKKTKGRTYIEFSPLKDEPAVLIDAKWGGRITQRLWRGDDDGENHLALATVVTSATLGRPGAPRATRFQDISYALGLDLTPGALDVAGCDVFYPKDFGKLSFVISHPKAPVPRRVVDEGDKIEDEDGSETHVAHVARMIRAAMALPKHGRCRILVLTTSFVYADAIHKALQAGGEIAVPVLNRQQESLAEAAEWFRENDHGILITPGAWEGFNVPGITHGIITRLPYAPPEDANGAPFIIARGGGNYDVSSEVVRVMQRLTQGIGRMIRQKSDDATIWVADARFGIPGGVAERGHFLIPTYPNGGAFHACVPVRFRRDLDDCEIFPLLEVKEAVKPSKKAVKPSKKAMAKV